MPPGAGRTGLGWLEALGPQVIRPGLSRTRALLASLGSPERSFRSLLVGGTNGKGSTAAFAAAILRAAGVRTGLYTSPHLVEVTERIRLDEEDVPPALLDDALSLVAAVSGRGALAPTYFEAPTVTPPRPSPPPSPRPRRPRSWIRAGPSRPVPAAASSGKCRGQSRSKSLLLVCVPQPLSASPPQLPRPRAKLIGSKS